MRLPRAAARALAAPRVPVNCPLSCLLRRLRLARAVLMVFLLCTLFSSVASAADEAPSPIPQSCVPLGGAEHQAVPLSGHLAILEDVGGLLDIRQVVQADAAGRFTPVKASVSRGFGEGTLWIRFCLPPSEHERLWLRASPAFIDHLTLYSPLAAAGPAAYKASSAGDMEAFETREMPFRDFLYVLDGDHRTQRTFYLQMRTASTRAVVLEAYTPAVLQAETGADYIHYGIFTGIAVLAVILNLALYFWLRDRTNLYYAINVALVCWTVMLAAGFVFQFWPGLAPAHANLRLGISILLLNASNIAFLAHVYRLREYFPWLQKGALAVAAFYLLAIPVAFFVDWRVIAVPTQSLIVFSQCAAVLTAAVLFWRHAHLRFYVIAFLPIQLNVLATYGRNIGLLPSTAFIINSSTIATATHILLLTIALARRAQQAEAEKKRMQDQALALSRQAERELESRVAARTMELSQANASLEREIAMRQILQGELQQALSTEQTAHAAQKEFVSMVSHEFRNPLAVIDTVAQRMEENLTERHPDLVASAGRMRRSVARLLALIENCLTEDRLSSPYMLPRVTPVDLTLLLKTHFGDQGPGGRVHLRLPEGAVTVHMDAHLIGTAISNLVENALKYSPAHQPVRVSLVTGNGHADVRVADHGAGIALDDQARIFEKFYRATDAQRLSGAGLGLYLARELAQRHGGDVSLVYSNSEMGTCFSLTLPLPMQVAATVAGSSA